MAVIDLDLLAFYGRFAIASTCHQRGHTKSKFHPSVLLLALGKLMLIVGVTLQRHTTLSMFHFSVPLIHIMHEGDGWSGNESELQIGAKSDISVNWLGSVTLWRSFWS